MCLINVGRADFPVRLELIAASARATGFTELAVRAPVAAGVADLPPHHRDPFDRLLVAQALAEPARFFAADTKLALYSELVTVIP